MTASFVPVTPSSRGLFTVTVLLVAAFGPYLVGGVRWEQVGVYTAAVVTIALGRSSLPGKGPLTIVVTAWLVYALVAMAASLGRPLSTAPWPPGVKIAGIDNVVLPLAVMTVVLGLLSVGGSRQYLLRRASLLTVVAMIVNTCAAVLQYGGADWSRWWSLGNQTTAGFAAAQGRFTGLVNAPAEAGYLYGIAMLCAIYLWKVHQGRLLMALLPLIVGGVLTVSKVFLLIALPVALWQLARAARGKASGLFSAATIVFSSWLFFRSGAARGWLGAEQLATVLPGDGVQWTGALTAGRLGDRGSLRPIAEAVWMDHPIFGYGVGGLRVPYDNGWVEALVTAGLVGAACYTVVVGALLVSTLRMPPGPERLLLGGIAVMVGLASLGTPVLTGNRVSTVSWLLLTLLLAGLGPEQGRTLVSVGGREQTSVGSN